ncbi:MAG: hypothetical protein MR009_04465 [Sutterellaceae bacterium]|nr:hypothetical protein [Sutterellaceae bacterium]MDD7442322.1 hypothetical protein [Sutterellaceae bacterium]MDY2868374.1 hypothetical protein [Mesosutterella sp.]
MGLITGMLGVLAGWKGRNFWNLLLLAVLVIFLGFASADYFAAARGGNPDLGLYAKGVAIEFVEAFGMYAVSFFAAKLVRGKGVRKPEAPRPVTPPAPEPPADSGVNAKGVPHGEAMRLQRRKSRQRFNARRRRNRR